MGTAMHSTLLVVAHRDALRRARDPISALLEVRARAAPASPAALLGVWVSPSSAATLERGDVEVPAGIAATSGLPGDWTLCWLTGDRPDRQTLLDRLLDGWLTAPEIAGGTGERFIPVFPTAAPESEVQREAARLRLAGDGAVDDPWLHDERHGRLLGPLVEGVGG